MKCRKCKNDSNDLLCDICYNFLEQTIKETVEINNSIGNKIEEAKLKIDKYLTKPDLRGKNRKK